MTFPPKKKKSSTAYEAESPEFWGTLLQSAVQLSKTVDLEREQLMVRAPNAIEWITGKNYCAQSSLFKHWGGYRLVKGLFELRCPNCNVGPNAVPEDPWGLSRETLESEVLLAWSEGAQDDVCPKCKTTRAEFIEDGILFGKRGLIGICGQRSGKSSTLGLIATYIEHVVLVIAHTYPGGLQGYFGMPAGEPLHITAVASTDTQAKETIWAKFRGYRTRSPWFQRYIPWIKAQEKMQKTPKGMQPWEYAETDKLIKHQLHSLTLDSLNSNSNGLAGRTRIAALIDEICRMKQTDSSQGAQEVYRTMDASCQTVMGAVEQFGLLPWLGIIASISSPISINDYGMQLLEAAKQDKKTYAMHTATWEFNPWMPYEFFADMLKKDYVGTMRNFGARPPGAANPLIDRPADFLSSAIDKSLEPTALFSLYEFVDKTGHDMLAVRLDKADLILGGAHRYIAADAGANFDAFSVACAHGEYDDNGNLMTVYDWVIRLLTKSKKQEVYFESIFQVMKELQQYMIARHIEFDHWNSKTIVQRLRNELGIFAEEVATKNEHFVEFMRDAYSGKVRMLPEAPTDISLDPPYKSAQGAALYELLHLERDPKNDKIFNSSKGLRRGWNSDDTARVIVHVHRLVQEQGYTERQDDTSKRAKRKRAELSGSEWTAQQRGQVFSVGVHGTRRW